MPYAPYGSAIYGETLYGVPPSTSPLLTTMSVAPVLSAAGTYNSLQVSWILPAAQATPQWNQIILVRSSYGVPVSPFSSDGVALVDVSSSPWPTTFVDTGLTSGRFYYYALFIYDVAAERWVLSASAQGLCLTDWGFEDTFYSWLPDFYLIQDALLITGSQPQGPLQRFLSLIGFEMNWIQSEISSIFTLSNPEMISGELLPYMSANLGIDYEPELGMTRSRVLVKNAVALYQTKGTLAGTPANPGGIQGAASAYSGYAAEITLSKNEEIQLDDAAFDRSTGHWVPENIGTTISIVPATSYFGVTPPHASYNPTPGLPGLGPTDYGSTGYLPVNNENVALISASSSEAWTEVLQTQVYPTARTGAQMAYDTSRSQFIMYGGTPSGGGYLTDTWQWNGTYWTQLSPTTIPTVSGYMAYDSTNSQIVLAGLNTSTSAFETWVWNGTNWVQKAPATSPSAGPVCLAPAKVGATLEIGILTEAAAFWTWNGTTWASQTGPPNVSTNWGGGIPLMAYSVSAGVTILLGSGDQEGGSVWTWSWNGTTWNQLYTSPLPFPFVALTTEFLMTYDGSTGNVILVATELAEGSAGATAGPGVWSYNVGTNAWSSVAATGPTPNRSAAGMAYYTGGNVVLFGGTATSGGTFLQDTQIFNGTAWAGAGQHYPSPREGAALCYDTSSSTVLLFGGQTGSSMGTTVLADTWSWNGTTWTQLAPAASPPARYNAAMVYTTGGTVILFGGISATGTTLADTWSWNGTTWAQITPTGAPSGGAICGQMAYDASAARVVLLNPAGQTWLYNVGTTTWTLQSPATSPSTRSYGNMVYTSGGDTLLFGGYNGSFALGDTWQWNGTTWAQLSTPAPPAARYAAAMAYNSATATVLLFGGTTGGPYSVLNDLWAYTPSTGWEQLIGNATEGNNGPARTLYSSGMVYDTSTSTVVLFGGSNGTMYLGDTWSLAIAAYGIYLSECNSTNATVLGLPISQQATPASITLSAYFRPAPVATPTLQHFYMQLDWYGVTGAYLSSTVGTAVVEQVNTWVRASVTGSPPGGAYYYGRTVKTSSTAMTGDTHFMDAVQTEYNSSATSWVPPRDIQINLFPVRQNLVPNPVGLGGTYSWTGTTLATDVTTPAWPEPITTGFSITLNGSGNGDMLLNTAQAIALNPGGIYSYSFYGMSPSHPATITFKAQFYNSSLTALPTVVMGGCTWSSTSLLMTTTGNFITSGVSPGYFFDLGGVFIEVVSVSANILTLASLPASGGSGSTQFVSYCSVTYPVQSAGSFERFSLAGITTPIAASYVTISATVAGTAAALYYLSGYMVEQVASVGSYFDGNDPPNPDYSFEGMPNESISDYYPNLFPRLARMLTVMPQFTPIGSTFSLVTGAQAFANTGLID